MLRISCLHTAEVHVATFEAARRHLRLDDVVLRHRVRADLLAAAERPGAAIQPILQRTADELGALAEAADAVLLTCSTLGPAAAMAQSATQVPVLRVDQALAREAVEGGGRVIVLCTAGTTIAPTRALFERAALLTGAEIEVRLVPGAWELFKAGDADTHCAMIAEAADIAGGEGSATIAFAQASMTDASKLCREVVPLTSPGVGLAAAAAAAQAAVAKSTAHS